MVVQKVIISKPYSSKEPQKQHATQQFCPSISNLLLLLHQPNLSGITFIKQKLIN